MRLLSVLLFLISIISIAKADYQYAFCKFNELSIGGVEGFAHLLSEDGVTLNITFDFTTSYVQNTQFAAQILTYGYNPSSMTNLGAVFDPTNVNVAGCPSGTPRAGDIGNIAANGGNVTAQTITLTIPNIKDNANSIIGRSIAIYSGGYDCSNPSKSVIGDMISFCTVGVGNIDYSGFNKTKLTGVNTASSYSQLQNAIGLAMVYNTTITKGDYIEGRVLFKAINSSFIQVSAKVSGLSYQAHGFHVHQFGDTSTVDGNSIGGHYLAAGQSHALPPNSTRHYGDFGNFCAFSQDMMDTGYYYYETDHVTAALVIGRGMAVHNFTDDGIVVGGARCSQGVIALIADQDFSLNIPTDWKWDIICKNGSYYGDIAGSMNSQSYSDNMPGSSSNIVPFFALIIFSIIFALL
ncbi:hypothetical protein RB653_001694 [Dictyostelium firmibasis]|uniref:Superoxide dismutase copper/zinc binding domain-containing protein n=1 Tax=Dictyostelium firmibasis TaxID=79012 RepID=A0AAN7TYX7_9MYCE